MSSEIRILIAEDLPSDADLAKREIQKIIPGARFEQVETREDFERALDTFKPDLIVSDYQMPSFDGLTALKIALQKTPLTPFIIHTGSMNEDTAVECMKAGATDYVIKEHIKRLGPAVMQALENTRIRIDKLRTQEALAESEDRFRRLIENADDLIYRIDFHPERVFSFVSPSAERITGYTPEEYYADPDLGYKLVHPDDKRLFDEVMNNPEKLREPLILRWKKKDGSVIWMEQKTVPVYDEEGRFVALEGIARDVTARKTAEEELRHSQRLLKFAGKLAQLGGWSVNLQENRVIWSDEVAAIHEKPPGYSPTVEEGIDFYAPEFQDRIKEVYSACVMEGIPYDEELQIITGKGNRVWVRTIGVAERDHEGIIHRVHGGFQNINERKEAENIRQTQYNIASSFITAQSVEELLDIIQDELTRVIDADHFSVAFHDREKDGFFDYFTDDQNSQRKSSLIKQKQITDLVLRKKQSVILKKKDLHDLLGNADLATDIRLPEVWLGVPMILNEGVMGIMVFENFQDAEAFENTDFQMLEILAGELSIYIQKKRNEEALLLAKEKAEESDRLKSAFLTNISHEIRTPMNAILGFLELLRKPDLAVDEQAEYIAIVNKSAQRLLTTINDLVELSKLEAGQAEVNFQEVDVGELLQTQYALFKPQADEKGLLLSLDNTEENDCITVCDRHKLQAVLVNMINNAIKFTPEGRINFGCSRDGEMLVFYVKDTGVGIPEGKQDLIFKRFVQADPEITRGYEGSGLGLSIADAYISLMGGKIWLESELGTGSTFYFSIPLKKPDREKKKEVKPTASGACLSGHRILVAEDDDMSYLYLEAVLEEHVEEMLRATTGEEVIEMLKENPDVSIILMDLKMPGMGGLQATREIRKFNQTIPIIAQTAHALEGDKNTAMEAGCSDYLTKPIRYDALLNVICANLGK